MREPTLSRKRQMIFTTATRLTLLSIALCLSLSSPLVNHLQKRESKETESVRKRLPMTFHRNLGQVDPNVRFFAHGGAYGVFLTADEGALVLTTSGAADRKKAHKNAVEENKAVQAVRWRFLNVNKQTKFTGLDELPFKTNYLRGNDRKQWQTNVEKFLAFARSHLEPGAVHL